MFLRWKGHAALGTRQVIAHTAMKSAPVSDSAGERFYRNIMKEGGMEMAKSRRCKELSNIEVIGIDHGNSQIKTVNEIFPTGIKGISTEPPFFEDILELDNSYYKIGGKRLEVKNTKSEDEDFKRLTYAAVAKELKIRKKQDAEVVLAVGLPPTRYGAEKKSFVDYLSKPADISFSYEQNMYHISIAGVMVFPQCFAAVADMMPGMGSKVVAVDIGSWTVDIIPIINRKPETGSECTLNDGIIPCMRAIQNESVRLFNEKIDEMVIQEYIMTGKCSLPKEYKDVMDSRLRCFADKIMKVMREQGYSLQTTQFVFVGGGASIIKNFGASQQSNIRYRLDVRANAKGYEMLAKIALKRG